jgi:hypothetical protein
MMGPFGRAILKYGIALSLVTMLVAFPGCGGGDKKKSETAGSSKKTSKSNPKSGSSKKSSTTQQDDEGPRTVGGIPFDVYFENPLAEASDQRLVAGGGAATPGGTDGAMNTGGGATTAATVEPEPEPAVASSDGPVWADLISPEELLSEVQSIRNDLNSRMVNFGAYKRATLEIPVFSSTLAFLADIARRQDGDIKWKGKAHFIRALAIQMVDVTSSSTAGVKKSYDAVNESYLKICDILDGNDPPELPEVEAEADFADFVEIGYLMKRLERGEKWLLTNVGGEDGFNEKGTLAQREVSLFAAISSSFKSEGFGYGEYEDFSGWADEFRDASRGMHKAVDAKAYDEFDGLRSLLSQKCTQCHGVYKE